MDTSLPEGILLGFVSGLAEVLPISAKAHQSILMQLFGFETLSPWLSLSNRIGALLAILIFCRGLLFRLYSNYRLSKIPKRRRKRQPDTRSMREISLVSIGFIPVLFSLLFYTKAAALGQELHSIVLFMMLNGIILYIPSRLPFGNKDAMSMSRLDGVLMGTGGALGLIPGFSGIGASVSFALVRGAEPQHALNWSFLLSVPVLLCLSGYDIYQILSTGIALSGMLQLVFCFLSGIAAYLGSYAAALLLRYMAEKGSFSGFAYYTWGAALFLFILYLTIG